MFGFFSSRPASPDAPVIMRIENNSKLTPETKELLTKLTEEALLRIFSILFKNVNKNNLNDVPDDIKKDLSKSKINILNYSNSSDSTNKSGIDFVDIGSRLGLATAAKLLSIVDFGATLGAYCLGTLAYNYWKSKKATPFNDLRQSSCSAQHLVHQTQISGVTAYRDVLNRPLEAGEVIVIQREWRTMEIAMCILELHEVGSIDLEIRSVFNRFIIFVEQDFRPSNDLSIEERYFQDGTKMDRTTYNNIVNLITNLEARVTVDGKEITSAIQMLALHKPAPEKTLPIENESCPEELCIEEEEQHLHEKYTKITAEEIVDRETGQKFSLKTTRRQYRENREATRKKFFKEKNIIEINGHVRRQLVNQRNAKIDTNQQIVSNPEERIINCLKKSFITRQNARVIRRKKLVEGKEARSLQEIANEMAEESEKVKTRQLRCLGHKHFSLPERQKEDELRNAALVKEGLELKFWLKESKEEFFPLCQVDLSEITDPAVRKIKGLSKTFILYQQALSGKFNLVLADNKHPKFTLANRMQTDIARNERVVKESRLEIKPTPLIDTSTLPSIPEEGSDSQSASIAQA